MNIANYFSVKLGYINFNKFKDIEIILSKIVKLDEISKLNADNFIKVLSKDKKNVGKSFRLILSKGVGKMFGTNP